MIDKILANLKNKQQFRQIPHITHDGFYISQNGRKMLNLSSNDYMAVALKGDLEREFLSGGASGLGSTSSRSLSGNYAVYDEFESLIATQFVGKSALLFNSGYHLNTACVCAMAKLKNTLIVADKQIHASMIDGLLMSEAKFLRYPHNDLVKLDEILAKNSPNFDQIIILSEALFSMDGDFCDILGLVELKRKYQNILLYIDEAHSVGAVGASGLGLCDKMGVANEIDFIVYTFGKALGSMGAAMICAPKWRDYFVNLARGLIYSTALPPINVAYTKFVFAKLMQMQSNRSHLAEISSQFRGLLRQKGLKIFGDTYIVFVLAGSNKNALNLAQTLQNLGYFAPAIRPPTVAVGASRLRLSLHAGLEIADLMGLVDAL